MHNRLLTFTDVSFTYPGGDHEVSRGINLNVAPGTITAILGPNGAGKTTFLHLALGWLQPQAGQVLFDGKPVESWSRRELGQRMALVPQRENSAFEHTVLETVILGRTPHLGILEMPDDKDFAIAQTSIDQCGLAAFATRSINCLSGGELQLVLLARALTQQPRLLLLDEPFSHLDLANKSRLMQVIRTLAANGVTILMTTHEPEIAAAIATHLVLMRAGRVQKIGELHEVLTGPLLSETYGIPVEVCEVSGRKIVLWC